MAQRKSIPGRIIKTLALPVGMFLFLFMLTKFMGRGQFSTWSSMNSVFRSTMIGSCISLAMACNMQNHRWDFSVGMLVILCPVLSAPLAAKLAIGVPGLLLTCITIGLLFGLVNGLTYLIIRVPAIVTSIGLMVIYESIILVFNGGLGARITDNNMLKLGQFPYIFIVAGTAFALFFVLYTFTKFGYDVRALASSQSLSVSAGIDERKNVIGCYLICGFFVGLAGTLYLSLTGTILADMRQNGSTTLMFEAFPPVFIGFYLMRYCNLTIGIIIGTLTMKLLTAGMLALGISSALQSVGIGVFLLLFIAVTTNQEKIREAGITRRKSAKISASGGAEQAND